jgi:DivIVA domain-containing protein
MALTEDMVANVTFRTKGRWYRAEEVDAFLEEVLVGVHQFQREEDRLTGKMEYLEKQVARLQEENKKLRAGAAKKRPSPAQQETEVLQALRRQQEQLIEDIKGLQLLRKKLYETIRQDTAQLLQEAEKLAEKD